MYILLYRLNIFSLLICNQYDVSMMVWCKRFLFFIITYSRQIKGSLVYLLNFLDIQSFFFSD